MPVGAMTGSCRPREGAIYQFLTQTGALHRKSRRSFGADRVHPHGIEVSPDAKGRRKPVPVDG